jgi:hypothetical protein
VGCSRDDATKSFAKLRKKAELAEIGRVLDTPVLLTLQ